MLKIKKKKKKEFPKYVDIAVQHKIQGNTLFSIMIFCIGFLENWPKILPGTEINVHENSLRVSRTLLYSVRTV